MSPGPSISCTDSNSDAILVNATLNCLALLIRSRPAVANKTISMILNFNPLKQANSPMTPRTRVTVKSMERSTRALLKNVNKRYRPHKTSKVFGSGSDFHAAIPMGLSLEKLMHTLFDYINLGQPYLLRLTDLLNALLLRNRLMV